MQICWRARTWACGRFWSNLSVVKNTQEAFLWPLILWVLLIRMKGISTKTWVTVTPNHDGSQSAAQVHRQCLYKSHVCFQMSLHIRNFKKAISVTALDKQQNQHRGKRNRQNMYTQIRSIWSWRYWMKTEIFLCFMFCLSYFFKNSKSLEG